MAAKTVASGAHAPGGGGRPARKNLQHCGF